MPKKKLADVQVPAELEDRALDAFAAQYGWSPTVADPDDPDQQVENPVSKQQFFSDQVNAYVRNVIASYEANAAAEKARDKAAAKAHADLSA